MFHSMWIVCLWVLGLKFDEHQNAVEGPLLLFHWHGGRRGSPTLSSARNQLHTEHYQTHESVRDNDGQWQRVLPSISTSESSSGSGLEGPFDGPGSAVDMMIGCCDMVGLAISTLCGIVRGIIMR
jgi:hypothetical protein